MSIMKYTRKYVLYSLIALVILCGVGAIVYSQIQREEKPIALTTEVDVPDTIDSPRQSMWQKITPKLKKNPKMAHSHDPHDDRWLPPSGPGKKLPRDLKKRLDKVRFDHGGHYTNSYFKSPNYFRDVYEAVSNGQDMETTIQLLKEYRIYTDVVLEHMDNYEAFKYVQNCSIDVDARKESAIKYAKRTISEDPSSAGALEAGLYMARMVRDPHEKETYLRGALKYHPDSSFALYKLGDLLSESRPTEAIPLLKKATDFPHTDQIHGRLGVAYEHLGDYKTAWVHYKKAHHANPNFYPWESNLKAIENGEPIFSPIASDPMPDFTLEGAGVPAPQPVEGAPVPMSELFVDDFAMPEDVPASVPPPESLSPEELARQESEHQAYLDMLDEQEAFSQRLETDDMFREAYFEEVEKFITWAESIMNDVPVETNNFLSKEMERHLLGKQTTFDPDRIKRGFEFINKYGQDEGLKRLHQKDPDLAKQVTQLLNEKDVPPRHPRDK